MTKYVAFLRAINVGGHTVKMDHLRGLFEELGLSSVETFIASGNVLFETTTKNATSLEKKIAAHLETSLGYAVATFIRTFENVVEIERRCPFSVAQKDVDVYVAFLHEASSEAVRSTLEAVKNKKNDFAVVDREIYWRRRDKDDSIFLKSSLEKVIKLSTTVRNMTSLHKLIEKHA